MTSRLWISASAADHAGQCIGDAGAVDDRRRQHAVQAEHALEGEGHQDEQQHAEQAGIEDRLERVGAGVLELRGVADRGLETVGRPCGDEHAAKHQRPAGDVPRAGLRRIGGGQRHQRRKIRPVDLAGEDRHDADDQHRDDDQQADIFLHIGGAEDAAMLDGEDDQHQHRADEEGGVEGEGDRAQRVAEQVQVRIAGVAAAATAAIASAGAVPACAAI